MPRPPDTLYVPLVLFLIGACQILQESYLHFPYALSKSALLALFPIFPCQGFLQASHRNNQRNTGVIQGCAEHFQGLAGQVPELREWGGARNHVIPGIPARLAEAHLGTDSSPTNGSACVPEQRPPRCVPGSG